MGAELHRGAASRRPGIAILELLPDGAVNGNKNEAHPLAPRVVECGSPLPLMPDAAQGGVSPDTR